MCSSSLERKISTSTGQAETYAMQSLVKEVVWERRLLEELGYGTQRPTPLFSDNDDVVKQSTKAVSHSTVKHYRIAQAYIRSLCNDGTIKVGRVSTENKTFGEVTKRASPGGLINRATHVSLNSCFLRALRISFSASNRWTK